MLSVRFPRELTSSVRYWARRDGVTVSEWIRKLVESEMATPNRQPPVDVSLYPVSKTASSGGHCRVEWLTSR
jgi:hypothetical protein